MLLAVLSVVLSISYGASNERDNTRAERRANRRAERRANRQATVDENTPSNVLFIIVDDLGWADVPSHVDEEYAYSLPNIESEIYGRGVEFTSYYTAPVCTPTRASFMTGKYAWKLGMQDVQTMPPCVDEIIPLDTPTIAEVLRDNLGYATYYVGKWHLGYAKWSNTPIGRGFDYAYGYLQGEGDYYNHTMHLEDIVGYDMFNMNEQAANWSEVGVYANDIYNRKALEYLSYQVEGEDGRNAGRPFYMYLSYQTIHEPIQIPTDNAYASECNNAAVSEERRIYCQKMKYLDDSIGNVINYLKNNGLYNNTLIVFTTDNGGMVLYNRTIAHPNAFYMPNSYGCNYPYRAGKATLFEGGIRSIGLLAGNLITQRNLGGTSSSLLLHAVDWFNTILEGAAGVDNTADYIASQGYNDGLTFDGVNVLNYLPDPTNCSAESCDVALDRLFIFPNIDITNALKENTVEVEVTRRFRVGRRQVELTEIETMDISNGYGPMPFDAVIFYDSATDTLWKYMRGYQLYYSYYDCYPNLVNTGDNYIPSDLWETTTEWLFNLSENPYEYESLNILSPNYQGITPNELTVATLMRSIADAQSQNGEFLAEQDETFYISGLPGCSGGTFEPWIDENDELINDECDPGCDFDCALDIVQTTFG